MTTLVTHPTATAQWYWLVTQAETAATPPALDALENTNGPAEGGGYLVVMRPLQRVG